MNRPALLATAGGVIAALMAATVATHASAPAASPAAVGAHVDDFQLTSAADLMAYQLYYYRYAPAVVLMSRVEGSKVSAAAAAKLETFKAKYAEQGVLFLMIDSSLGQSREAAAAQAAKEKLTIPVLMDEQQLVGESLGVKREAEVFVLDPKSWRVAYHGPVENTAQAVDAVMAKSAPAITQAAVITGKTIAFPGEAMKADFAKISYSHDVAPILQQKCAACHISGGIGPFPMDSYEVIKGFAPMIRETVRTQRMPPYFADPHIGVFKNDQGLTGVQKATLVHWVEAGAPRGDGPDPLLENKGKVAPAWPVSLGQPDVIVDLPAFKVPASGLVEYQWDRVPNPFKENTWLKAISIRPGDRRVLHHVVSQWSPNPGDPTAKIPGGSVGSYTPGAEAQIIPADAGAPIPAGGKLNFQMHYTTMGKESVDTTKVGFYTLKTEPKYIKRSMVIAAPGLYIPAGEARHKEVAYMTFPADAYLYTLYPHAHYRGMHVELKQRTPDGRETMLLALPKYDFNWQRDYDPIQPILVKAGTKLIATWVYDNSDHNPANPDAKRNVTWGEQTPDEMMYFRVNYRWADETVEHIRPDLDAKLRASELIGGLDSNLDGFIEPEELKGPLARLKPRFAALDKNHDGKLDASELTAVNIFQMARSKNKDDNPDL